MDPDIANYHRILSHLKARGLYDDSLSDLGYLCRISQLRNLAVKLRSLQTFNVSLHTLVPVLTPSVPAGLLPLHLPRQCAV